MTLQPNVSDRISDWEGAAKDGSASNGCKDSRKKIVCVNAATWLL